MSTTQPNPFSSPANQTQPNVFSQFNASGIDMTPPMQAVQNYRARGGRSLGAVPNAAAPQQTLAGGSRPIPGTLAPPQNGQGPGTSSVATMGTPPLSTQAQNAAAVLGGGPTASVLRPPTMGRGYSTSAPNASVFGSTNQPDPVTAVPRAQGRATGAGQIRPPSNVMPVRQQLA